MFRILILVLTVMAAQAAQAADAVLRNQVANHPSPYLALHGQDPVHWQTWSRETLQKAHELNRPLLVSIGYFSCHWCHVMQRESYQDPELAKLLNENFVAVKVDRELDPALDAHLIEFVELTRGNAGWPLNVFLTPEGYPILGMTYLPRDNFYELLDQLKQRWDSEPSRLRQLAQDAMNEWRQLRQTKSGGKKPLKTSAVQGLLTQMAPFKDDLSGGFGQQNKFPMVSQLSTLLWIAPQRDDTALDDFIRLTLDRMADQGLHDTLGGGFFRYTTDPAWQVPHYEKMLYDNAQLAVLYLRAAEHYRSPRYREVGLSTLDFLLRDMRRPEGYFISSFSAVDAQGREGFYYLWDDSTLERLLNDEQLSAIRSAWFSDQPAHSDYGQLPRWQGRRAGIAKKLGWSEARLDQVLGAARDTLLQARSRRSLPADDKGLAAWNGLMLSALAAGYAATGDKRYRQAAERLADYIVGRLWDGKRLVRARDKERVLAEASLEDYALVARGLWDWHQQIPDEGLRSTVERMVRVAWRDYFVNDRWVQSDAPLIPMLDGQLALDDSPLPSATATITALSVQHPQLNKDAAIRKKVAAHLNQVSAHLGDALFWYASYVELLEPA